VSLQTNRILGGVGSLLVILGSVFSFVSLAASYSSFANLFEYPLFLSQSARVNFVPSFFSTVGSAFSVLSIIGIILGLVAMKGLADYYGENRIFGNTLYALVSSIAGVVVTGGVAFAVVFLALSRVFSGVNPFQSASFQEIFRSLVLYFIPIFVVAFIAAFIVVFFIRRALNVLAEKSGVMRFRFAGSLFLVNVVVLAVLGFAGLASVSSGLASFATLIVIFTVPGGVVNLAVWILVMVAFFSIKVPAGKISPASQAPAPVAQAMYCPYCGAQSRTDAVYCRRCGKNL
jgi:uncharacterized membrane protein